MSSGTLVLRREFDETTFLEINTIYLRDSISNTDVTWIIVGDFDLPLLMNLVNAHFVGSSTVANSVVNCFWTMCSWSPSPRVLRLSWV